MNAVDALARELCTEAGFDPDDHDYDRYAEDSTPPMWSRYVEPAKTILRDWQARYKKHGPVLVEPDKTLVAKVAVSLAQTYAETSPHYTLELEPLAFAQQYWPNFVHTATTTLIAIDRSGTHLVVGHRRGGAEWIVNNLTADQATALLLHPKVLPIPVAKPGYVEMAKMNLLVFGGPQGIAYLTALGQEARAVIRSRGLFALQHGLLA